jgi:hypothetical protein
MATSTTYYIDTDNFSTATAVWINSGLTTKAPDGYYSFGDNYRQQFEGLLLAITSCTAPPPPEDPSISITSTICNTSDGGSTVRKRFRISVGNPPSDYTIANGTIANPAGLTFSVVTTPGNSYLEVTFRPSVTFGNEFSIELLLKNSSGTTVATSGIQTVYGDYQSFLPSCP